MRGLKAGVGWGRGKKPPPPAMLGWGKYPHPCPAEGGYYR